MTLALFIKEKNKSFVFKCSDNLEQNLQKKNLTKKSYKNLLDTKYLFKITNINE